MGYMPNPSQLERLTEGERAKVQALMDSVGWRETARRLGVFSEMTLWKICAGALVSRLTAITVREHLAAAQEGE